MRSYDARHNWARRAEEARDLLDAFLYTDEAAQDEPRAAARS